ncbi:hypothetical protein H0266_18300 [Halobacillus locisalis]|uniref:SbsA Ig-like domain-containing protein n=1 Tax=Halobacillus locisalis TaxID=220753 RepID=A0A838CY33_9BACI|nr:stalk domain-containing protein [Halobacillus locisalis]MBA2176834.1 hypothetical protein [Halobacillus locisalis]
MMKKTSGELFRGMRKNIAALSLVVATGIFASGTVNATTTQYLGEEVPVSKEWTITFNTEMDLQSIKDSLSVEGFELADYEVSYGERKNVVVLKPIKNYELGSNVSVSFDATSSTGVSMKEDYTFSFDVVEDVVPEWADMSVSELEQTYGVYKFMARYPTSVGLLIKEFNWYDDYVEDVAWYKERGRLDEMKTPEQYINEMLEDHGGITTLFSSTSYPDNEVISFNGKPFLDSKIYDSSRLDDDDWGGQYGVEGYAIAARDYIAHPPSNKGDFLLDINRDGADFVIYKKDGVNIQDGLSPKRPNPYLGESEQGETLYVDVKDVFGAVGEVDLKDEQATISYQGNILEIQDGDPHAKLNGKDVQLSYEPQLHQEGSYEERLMVESREVAELLGLHTRSTIYYYAGLPDRMKLEVANYDLGADREFGIEWNG